MKKLYCLVKKDDNKMDAAALSNYRVNGVRLSSAPMEQMSIVDVEEVPEYTEDLFDFFDKQGFAVVTVGMQGA